MARRAVFFDLDDMLTDQRATVDRCADISADGEEQLLAEAAFLLKQEQFSDE